MKTSIRWLSILLAIAILANTNSATAQLKIGYINFSVILEKYKEAHDAHKQLQELIRRWDDEAENMQKNLQEKQEWLESAALLLSDARREEKELEIQNLSHNLQQFQRVKFGQHGEIFTKRAELMGALGTKINDALKKISTDESIDYIFDAVNTNTLYINPKLSEYVNPKLLDSTSLPDLTGKVLEELNRSITAPQPDSTTSKHAEFGISKLNLASTDIGLPFGHSWGVTSVVFSSDGKIVISGCYDGTIRFWDTETGNWIRTIIAQNHRVLALAVSPNGTTLASSYDDQTVKLWDVQTGKLRMTLTIPLGTSRSVVFSPNGKLVASGGYTWKVDGQKTKIIGGEVKIWNIETGELKLTLSGHSMSVNAISFSPNGNTLASASDDKTLKLWDVQTGEVKMTLQGHKGEVKTVAFSPDGQILASGGDDKTVKIWNVETGQLTKTLTGYNKQVECVVFSHDGKTLASSSFVEIKLWNPQTNELKRTWIGHSDLMSSVIFSSDDMTLASASYDQTVKLWDVQTGQLKQTIAGYDPFIGLDPKEPTWPLDVDFVLFQSDQAYSGLTPNTGESSIQIGGKILRKTSPQSTIYTIEPSSQIGETKKYAGFWIGLPGKTYNVAFSDKFNKKVAVVELRGAVRWYKDGNLMRGERNFLRMALESNGVNQLIIKREAKNGGIEVTLEDGSTFFLYEFSHDFTGLIEKLNDKSLAEIIQSFAEIAKKERNWEMRRNAVRNLSDPAILADIAKTDPVSHVRLEAVKKLTDQNLLSAIVKLDDSGDVRLVAVEKLTDQVLLTDIAKNDVSMEMRITAVNRLTDQIKLAEIAKNDARWQVRKAAVDLLTDQNLLLEISFNDVESFVRNSAKTRLQQLKNVNENQ